MKVTLKSQGLDLELDNVESLEKVLEFVQSFKELELKMDMAKRKLDIETHEALKAKPQRRTK